MSSESRETKDVQGWFYSSAQLSDVIEFIPCIDSTRERHVFIGVLLVYRHGKQGCLGQYRADLAADVVRVPSGSSLCIGVKRYGISDSYVAELTVEGGPKHNSLQWSEYCCVGELEWRYTAYGDCALRHIS